MCQCIRVTASVTASALIGPGGCFGEASPVMPKDPEGQGDPLQVEAPAKMGREKVAQDITGNIHSTIFASCSSLICTAFRSLVK